MVWTFAADLRAAICGFDVLANKTSRAYSAEVKKRAC